MRCPSRLRRARHAGVRGPPCGRAAWEFRRVRAPAACAASAGRRAGPRTRCPARRAVSWPRTPTAGAPILDPLAAALPAVGQQFQLPRGGLLDEFDEERMRFARAPGETERLRPHQFTAVVLHGPFVVEDGPAFVRPQQLRPARHPAGEVPSRSRTPGTWAPFSGNSRSLSRSGDAGSPSTTSTWPFHMQHSSRCRMTRRSSSLLTIQLSR